MDDLQIKDQIKVKKGIVVFDGFENIKLQALEIYRICKETVVSEETIKENKKMLANLNKGVKALDAKRIEAKKEILSPYEILEGQIKEITGIAKEAELLVRDQIRVLEEQERDEKEAELRELWELRFRPYTKSLGFIKFEDFLTPQHLNKSLSVKKIEDEMATWLESMQNSVQAIIGMENQVEVLAEFQQCLDLPLAISTVTQRKAREKDVQVSVEKLAPKSSTVTVFIIEDEKDAKLAEMLLKENKIKFAKETK